MRLYWDNYLLMEEAKRLAAGPLGGEMNKFPLRFAAPVFFGFLPAQDTHSKINNGTVSLITIGGRLLAITCSHVLSAFKGLLEEEPNCVFQIGNCKLDPLSQLVYEDEGLDLAVIELTKKQIEEIPDGGEIGASMFQPIDWPSPKVKEGEFIAFGGFPGKWREEIKPGHIDFSTYSSGASGVTTCNDTCFVSQFEREYWVKSFDTRGVDHLAELGGLSGGPAFVFRELHWDFVGIIFEFSTDFELLYLRYSSLIEI